MELLLKVDEKQAEFFLELIRKFDFVHIQEPVVEELSPEEKSFLDERMQKCQPQNFLEWEAFRREIIECQNLQTGSLPQG
jgi:hypothetical protein